jgi:hypothetical protein
MLISKSTLEHHFRRALMLDASADFNMSMLEEFWLHSGVHISFKSPCRSTGHFLLLIFDDFESSLTILSLMHLVFIMGRSPLDMSLKRVSAMDYNSF